MSLWGNAAPHPVHPDTVSTTAPTTALQRRLSPLETAAAVAIILSCLVATAMMTGLLPQAPHPAASVRAVTHVAGTTQAALPAVTAITAPGAEISASAIDAAGAGRAAEGRLPTEPNITMPTTLAAPMPMPVTVPVPVPPNLTSNRTAAPVRPGAAAAASNNATAAIPASRRQRVQPAYRHSDLPARQSRGKTREEVVAELLRAKRDGSYSKAMEAYR